MLNWKSRSVAAGSVGALTMAGPAAAADFPTKPISIIIGFGAGGGTDAMIRAVAEPMAQSLGQAGARAEQARSGRRRRRHGRSRRQSPTDIHLSARGSLTFTFEPQVLKTQYASTTTSTHIAIISLFQDGLFTHPSRPYKTMRDVIDAAKAEKRDIKYASQYQLDKLIFEYVAKQEGVEFIPVPTQRRQWRRDGNCSAIRSTLASRAEPSARIPRAARCA